MIKHPISNASEIVPVVGLSSDEQEFTITAGRNDKTINIFVSDNVFLTKVKKAFAANPTNWTGYVVRDREGSPVGYFFETSKKCLTLRSKERTRSLTEEQLTAMREHMQKMQANRKKKV